MKIIEEATISPMRLIEKRQRETFGFTYDAPENALAFVLEFFLTDSDRKAEKNQLIGEASPASDVQWSFDAIEWYDILKPEPGTDNFAYVRFLVKQQDGRHYHALVDILKG
jgi:hypothetical protein